MSYKTWATSHFLRARQVYLIVENERFFIGTIYLGTDGMHWIRFTIKIFVRSFESNLTITHVGNSPWMGDTHGMVQIEKDKSDLSDVLEFRIDRSLEG